MDNRNLQDKQNENLNQEEELENLSEDTSLSQEEKEESAEDKIEKMGEKLEEVNDKFLRLYSDFENFRKRTAKEKVDMIKYASEQTIVDLLPIIDDYQRAMDDLDNHDNLPQTAKEGLILIHSKLLTFLEQKGVKEIVAKGEKFDENLHEAITQFPVENEKEKGLVVDVLLKGYTMYDKVIRYAKVVVGI